jgi:hypothetical protein
MRRYHINQKSEKLQRLLMFTLIVLIIVCPASSGGLFGQTSTSEHKINKEYFRQFGRDVVSVVSSPGQWKGKDFLTLTAVVGTGALIFAYDQKFKLWMEDYRLETYEDVSNFITNLGDGAFLVSMLASYYLAGEIFNRDNMRKIALLGMESFLISGSLVALLKYTIGRARPYTGESKQSFHPFSSSSQFYSFPSGHSAAAFSVATVIAQHSKEVFVDILSYGLAGCVALSRIQRNKHWASDVFFGSAIGYFIGKKISDLNRNGRSDRLQIGFQLSPGRQAFSLSYTF